ncbi:glycoside hydrolase family 108 protein [Yoonia vestfoldensis]|uniref:Glycosyl hydrolase 108 n=1 Tax=Yoonia vestfoldensis TaxID=245188 RepID=A0A1Y0EHU9_9RHOB|nr:glycoside hydrolase family 108 protein [Yoonia vestfoldensis]ARU02961.1 glycosyl hydrolase 108 [Yoonia vestfoldensis]
MTASNFIAVMDEVFAHEGGFVNHPKDPGGATNWGITIGTLSAWRGARQTADQVRALTKEEARKIYRTQYWDKVRGDNLPAGIDLVAMDGGVNSGVRRGAQWVQRALGVSADGKVGPVTINAALAADHVAIIVKACAIRMGFLRALSTFSTFGRGWSRRVASVEAVGVRMATVAKAEDVRPVLLDQKAKAQAKASKEQAGAAAVPVGGAGGTTLADLPTWGLIGLGVAVIVVAVLLLGRARHDKERADAYQRIAEGSAP